MDGQPLHVYSKKYPPVKQLHTGLGVVEIEVRSADRTHRFNPNSAAVAGQTKNLTEKFGDPVATSVISGEPGYLYRTSVVEIPLTAEEIARLFAHSLEPQEFLALARSYGVFYEISSKFYNEDTGIAIDPNYSQAQRKARAEVEKLPHLLVVRAAGAWHLHSLISLFQSEYICGDLASQGRDFRLVPVRAPANTAELSLLCNVVALHVSADGILSAVGPYTHSAEAQAAAVAPSTEVHIGSVPAFAI